MDSKLKDQIADYLKKVINDQPEEERADAAHWIAVQAVIWGADNTFQGVGVLELAKKEYFELCEDVMNEPNCDECDNDECQFKKFKDN